ncbi:hypothetical protein G6046_19780, partial [Bacillus amyloliquefaciens]|nr:hypothetical protein [Bacillus amyloliquefaciens]
KHFAQSRWKTGAGQMVYVATDEVDVGIIDRTELMCLLIVISDVKLFSRHLFHEVES